MWISRQVELVRSCRLKEGEILSLTQQLEMHANQLCSVQEELCSANSQLSDLSNSYMVGSIRCCLLCVNVNAGHDMMGQRAGLDRKVLSRFLFWERVVECGFLSSFYQINCGIKYSTDGHILYISLSNLK